MKQLKRNLALGLALLLSLLPLSACGNGDTMTGFAVIGGKDGPTQIVTTNPGDAQPAENADHDALPADSGGEALGPAVTGSETILLGDTVLDEEGWYASKEEVALYLMEYGSLPLNYITKKEAQALGWEGGSLEPYAPGKSIGGDHFGNYEGALPEKDGRSYTECDIDTQGADKRGTKRIIFSNDGLIFYTEDHYETFTIIQGEE
ncbi:ribonuclease domain-containing protein [Agathobaculum sp.]|uniref:ribonuclease domain-containing protein n=1 Tax=Agathobaculum sp. TaxID=2048138 RepID=UPI002A81D2C6|nr:ribonuclease domain-containing protein [Agathobaculum sp.]MDY3619286.1 ribonuclease domain-containing protein [Agathobaculum sp.]